MKSRKDKSTLWNMRATKADKENFSKLAKRLQVKKSKAIRLAVVHMLEVTGGLNAGNHSRNFQTN